MHVSTDVIVVMSVVGVLVAIIAGLLAIAIHPREAPFAMTQPLVQVDARSV
jgi:hypothetical protein